MDSGIRTEKACGLLWRDWPGARPCSPSLCGVLAAKGTTFPSCPAAKERRGLCLEHRKELQEMVLMGSSGAIRFRPSSPLRARPGSGESWPADVWPAPGVWERPVLPDGSYPGALLLSPRVHPPVRRGRLRSVASRDPGWLGSRGDAEFVSSVGGVSPERWGAPPPAPQEVRWTGKSLWNSSYNG